MDASGIWGVNEMRSRRKQVVELIRYYERGLGQFSKKAPDKLTALRSELASIPIAKEPAKPRQIYAYKGRYKPGSRCKTTGGITRQLSVSGCGSSYIRWQVSMTVAGRQMLRTFSEEKYGRDGAKLLCSLYKMAWLIESGVWNPKDGDVFAQVAAGGFFSGREDMVNTGCDYETYRQIRGIE